MTWAFHVKDLILIDQTKCRAPIIESGNAGLLPFQFEVIICTFAQGGINLATAGMQAQKAKPQVIFVLGGPGSGKGTQVCAAPLCIICMGHKYFMHAVVHVHVYWRYTSSGI